MMISKYKASFRFRKDDFYLYMFEQSDSTWNRNPLYTYCSNQLGDMVPAVGRPVQPLNPLNACVALI